MMKGSSSRLARFLFLSGKRSELGMALVFLALILIPSALLGYLSWRALQSEKLLAEERLSRSYQRYARLAARKINEELEELKDRWLKTLKRFQKRTKGHPAPEDFDRLIAEEPLITGCFYLSAPGRVEYPPNMAVREGLSPAPWKQEAFVREHEIFSHFVARGEDLEYRQGNLTGAIAAYRRILERVQRPQLRAMALSYIGRVYLKKGELQTAIEVHRQLLRDYPEARDLNDMYLRFLAQYQIAVAQESMGRDEEAVQTLIRLVQDMFQRSDAISVDQYQYFMEQVRILAVRLLSSRKLSRPDYYRELFRAFTEKNKKRLSQKYFLEILDRRLYKAVVERKRYRSRIYFISNETVNEPYLLGYRFLPGPSRRYVGGVIGLTFDLKKLGKGLLPRVLSDTDVGESVIVAILNGKNEVIFSSEPVRGQLIATQPLKRPFSFWQVGLYVDEAHTPANLFTYRNALGLWFITVLMLSILLGAIIFVRRAMREAYLSRLKSNFVSNVSHELRTPIASIKMLAELMEMQNPAAKSGPARKNRQYLQVIQRECDRLSRLIDNVLDFAKIEKGMKSYQFRLEQPDEVLQMAVESFRPHAEANGFRIRTDIAPLPPAMLDRDAIAQVMLNLLSNAVKYSRDDKIIDVRAFLRGDEIVVEVQDRGIGIPEHEIPRIFDDFYRVDQRLNTQAQGGMGLGLTLVRHIVEAHGGRVEVESEVGVGSTFRFTLPSQQATNPSDPQSGVASDQDQHEPQQTVSVS
ncbi:MAG: ATP-binding protein [candidate division KSB1 bacterium]|nr:ATP-binding protein [candidate division KSB1 bacterium]MDQ7065420.1 ATP-binding protein [candidate division KSB1 bacterium]